MGKPLIVVSDRKRKEDLSLFADLMEDEPDELGAPNETKERFANLCNGKVERERVGWLSEQATHIIHIYDGSELKTFGFVNVNPYIYGKGAADYVELILLCGSYVAGPWKGSEMVVDKTIQLARDAGKQAVRLEALNDELLKKVYVPMGFTVLPGVGQKAELRPLPAVGGKKSWGGVMSGVEEQLVGRPLDRDEREKLQEASRYARQQYTVPGAPMKEKFPWALFREVLEEGKSVQYLEEKLQELLLPPQAFEQVSIEGKTPLQLAEEKENDELVEVLEAAIGTKGGRRRRVRRSRLNVKRRGTKRNGRSRKDRKLRKLTTRRR